MDEPCKHHEAVHTCMERVKKDMDALKVDVEQIKTDREERSIIIAGLMPRSWLWRMVVIVAPVTAIALTILIFQATAGYKFADRETTIRMAVQVDMLERRMMLQEEMNQKIVINQQIIMRDLGAIKDGLKLE